MKNIRGEYLEYSYPLAFEAQKMIHFEYPCWVEANGKLLRIALTAQQIDSHQPTHKAKDERVN